LALRLSEGLGSTRGALVELVFILRCTVLPMPWQFFLAVVLEALRRE
jgi:hypothetical protein